MKVAHHLQSFPHLRADAAVYRLKPPLITRRFDWATEVYVPASYTHVVVSGLIIKDQAETLIFPAEVSGHLWWREVTVIDWGTRFPVCWEINHEKALAQLGYTLR